MSKSCTTSGSNTRSGATRARSAAAAVAATAATVSDFAVCRHESGVTASERRITLRVRGDIDLLSVTQFRDAAFTAMGEKPRRLLLDLSEVGYLDTTGLSTLVTLVRVSRMVKVSLTVIPSPFLRRLLEKTGMSYLVPVEAAATILPDGLK